MITEEMSAKLLDAPIPGESLTQDPDNKQPWETAPEYTKLEEFMDDLFMNITNEGTFDGVLDALRQGIAVEDVANMFLLQAFVSGKITVDLQLMAVEPTIFMLIGLGEYAGVKNMQLYPEDSMVGEETDAIKALEEAAGEKVTIAEITAPAGISPELLAKLKEGQQGEPMNGS